MQFTRYNQVGLDNVYMRLAYEVAKILYKLKKWNKKALPVAVLVKDGKVLAVSASGEGRHQSEGRCAREDLGLHDGEGYEKCENCRPDRHSERLVVLGADAQNADVYVYGHYYFCDTCQAALKKAGVKNWYVLNDSQMLFNKKDPGCVIGKPEQFEA